MAENLRKIADLMGAEVVGTVPEAGGGAFGAARLGRAVDSLRSRLRPTVGVRPGRPTDAAWTRHPKVPMTSRTEETLIRIAARISTGERRISPMQLAAQLLEDAVGDLERETS